MLMCKSKRFKTKSIGLNSSEIWYISNPDDMHLEVSFLNNTF